MYNVILLNLDKLHDTPIDTSLKPPVLSALTVQDDTQVPAYDPQEPAYDDIENPITDELLAELNKITDD